MALCCATATQSPCLLLSGASAGSSSHGHPTLGASTPAGADCWLSETGMGQRTPCTPNSGWEPSTWVCYKDRGRAHASRSPLASIQCPGMSSGRMPWDAAHWVWGQAAPHGPLPLQVSAHRSHGEQGPGLRHEQGCPVQDREEVRRRAGGPPGGVDRGSVRVQRGPPGPGPPGLPGLAEERHRKCEAGWVGAMRRGTTRHNMAQHGTTWHSTAECTELSLSSARRSSSSW